MTKYISEFKSLEGETYYVSIFKEGHENDSTEVREITLSGENPVVITQSVPSTVFEPLRKTVCSIRVLLPDYPIEDLFTSKLDTIVKVEKKSILIGSRSLIFVGYLQPGLYSQGYDNEIEELELDASDYISVLQYFDYRLKDSTKGAQIVSVRDILAQITDASPLLTAFAIRTDKMYYNDVQALPLNRIENLMISEANFFSEEDEPWTLEEVLFEVCQYLGLVAIQNSFRLELFDPMAFNADGKLPSVTYYKSDGYTGGKEIFTGGRKTVTAESYRGSGNSIDVMDIINKVKAVDNFYQTDDVLPDLFDDELLTPTMGSWEAYGIGEYNGNVNDPDFMPYVNKGKDKVFYRPFTHKYWKNRFYQISDTGSTPPQVVPPAEDMSHFRIMKNYVGGMIVDQAHEHKEAGKPNQSINFTRYACLARHGIGIDKSSNEFIYPYVLECSSTKPIIVEDNTFIVIDAKGCVSLFREIPGLPQNMALSIKDMNKFLMDTSVGANQASEEQRLSFQIWIEINGMVWQGSDVHGVNIWKPVAEVNHHDRIMMPLHPLPGKGRESEQFFQKDSSIDPSPGDLFIGTGGRAISLPEGTKQIDYIKIKIGLPNQYVYASNPVDRNGYHVGAEYLWLSDFSVKLRRKNQALAKKNDEAIENILDENDRIHTGQDLTFKITTANSGYSYSNMGCLDSNGKVMMLKQMYHPCFKTNQSPEENVIQGYVEQYSTPTIRETVTLGTDYDYNNLVTDSYWQGKEFYVVGMETDLGSDSSRITLEEKKKICNSGK